MQGPGRCQYRLGLAGRHGRLRNDWTVGDQRKIWRPHTSVDTRGGVCLIILVVFLDDFIRQIPMAALVAVMIMVSIGTFSWESVTKIREYPLSSNIVLWTTVGVVVATHNLAIGVFVGVLLAALFFANKVGHYMGIESHQHGDTQHYRVTAGVFRFG